MQPKRKFSILSMAIIVAILILGYLAYGLFSKTPAPVAEEEKKDTNSVELSDTQVKSVKIETLGTYNFPIEKMTTGSVAYNQEGSNSAKLVVANISESDSPSIRIWQAVHVQLTAYPDRVFEGKVSAVGRTVYDSGDKPAIDPVTHRITIHCKISDPKNELYSGMLANVTIQVKEPQKSVAIPEAGIVRKGDGTMTAWVTSDGKKFEEKTVKIGLQKDGYDQVLEGLKSGEMVATDGAIFLNNILYAPPSD